MRTSQFLVPRCVLHLSILEMSSSRAVIFWATMFEKVGYGASDDRKVCDRNSLMRLNKGTNDGKKTLSEDELGKKMGWAHTVFDCGGRDTEQLVGTGEIVDYRSMSPSTETRKRPSDSGLCDRPSSENLHVALHNWTKT